MAKRNDVQFCLKLAAPLRAAVEDDAAALERSASWVIRRILIDHYKHRGAERTEKAA
jgi:hypothetical protein